MGLKGPQTNNSVKFKQKDDWIVDMDKYIFFSFSLISPIALALPPFPVNSDLILGVALV